MGGVSGPKTVSGAGGYGKVELKFRKISDKKKSRIGGWIFAFGLCLLVFKTLWGWPNVRRDYLSPALREIVGTADSIRLRASSYFSESATFAIPNQRGAITLVAEVSAPTDIHRDVNTGYVYINASSFADAVYAQGYVHATDRLGQMDSQRRRAKGLLSEVFGKQHLEADRLFRTLGLHNLAIDDWQRLQATAAKASLTDADVQAAESSREQARLLEAYSRGVNAAIKSSRSSGTLPLHFFSYVNSWWTALHGSAQEVEPWHPIDTLVLLRLQAFQWSHGWDTEVAASLLHKTLGAEDALKLGDLDRSAAAAAASATSQSGHILQSYSGNVWAARGPQSPSSEPGKPQPQPQPLLVTDIPAICEQRCPWYMNSLQWTETETDVRLGGAPTTKVPRIVRGTSQPGIPLVSAGSTGHASWGLAVSPTDTEDVYEETLRVSPSPSPNPASDSPDVTLPLNVEVLHKGSWRAPASIRMEHIPVAPTAVSEKLTYFVPHRVVVTSHGPVVGNLTDAHVPLRFRKSTNYTRMALEGGSSYTELSLCSQSLRQPSDIAWLVSLARASSRECFSAAATLLKTASMYIVFAVSADAMGEGGKETPGAMGYVTSGEPVVRAPHHRGTLPVSAADSADGSSDWQVKDFSDTDDASATKVAVSTFAPVIAIERRLLDSNESLLKVLEWAQSPSESGAELLFNDNFSAFALRFRDLLLAAPSLQVSAIQATEDVDMRSRLLQGVAVLKNFDGRYSHTAIGAVVLEASAEQMMQYVVSKAEPILALLRGAPLSAARRDKGMSALLSGRSWLLALMAPLLSNTNTHADSTLASSGHGDKTSGGLCPSANLCFTASQLDRFARDSLLYALNWVEDGFGVNKNYRNTKWQWGYVHRSRGAHPARYHSIINSILSAPQNALAGTHDTLDGTPPAFSDQPAGTSILDETDGLHVYGHASAARMAGHVGGVLRGSLSFGQSEHLGAPWGGGRSTVHDWATFPDLNAEAGSVESSPRQFSVLRMIPVEIGVSSTEKKDEL